MIIITKDKLLKNIIKLILFITVVEFKYYIIISLFIYLNLNILKIIYNIITTSILEVYTEYENKKKFKIYFSYFLYRLN